MKRCGDPRLVTGNGAYVDDSCSQTCCTSRCCGASMPRKRRIQRFRRAWDIVGESFGARHQPYERSCTGDPVSLMAARHLHDDKTTAVEHVQAL
jgi:hypothetical protein